MAHWRDGGIGNMAGSDDREAEEFTLLEQLAVIAGHSKTDAQFDVAGVADAAFEEIRKFRDYPLTIEIDPEREVITIAGIRYAFSLFTGFGWETPLGTVLQVARRDDGVLTIIKLHAQNVCVSAPKED